MKEFTRADRVRGQMKKLLSDILQKEIQDPRLEGVLVTSIKMAKDLRLASIYFICPAGSASKKEEVLKGFKSALGYIKRTLARKLGLRYMPDLRFFYDDSFDYGERIDSVLESLKSDHGSDNTTT